MRELLRAVSKSRAPEILLFLGQRGRVRHAELKDLAPPATLFLRLREFAKLGLLRVERKREVPPKTFYSLTPKGRRVADLLKEFENL